MSSRRIFSWIFIASAFFGTLAQADTSGLENIFLHPPAEARPWVYWFWMGSTITSNGISGDLQALHDAGFGGSVMCSMADICTPWPAPIANPPTPDIVTFNDKWWQLVRHAAQESHRLGLEFGIGNCAGYETCGGPWVTPEFSMQEVVWSETKFSGPGKFSGAVPKPNPDIHAHMPFPVYIGNTGRLEKPEVPARKTYFRDIAVLAVPAKGDIATNQIFDLSDQLSPDGKLDWDAPTGDWVIYRFGHTTMGSLLQPCQWEAIGLQSDLMSRTAMEFNLDHLTGDIQKHAGDLIGKGLNFVWFDSYEAGTPTWTPKMREEFQTRRGYGLTKYLPTMAKRTVGSAAETKKFNEDFQRTVRDLYRDVYFSVIPEKLHAAGLKFCNEPYWGPWQITEVITNLDNLVAEFWVRDGKYNSSAVPAVVAAAREHGLNRISAEAFTAGPKDSQWQETPASLKLVGDAAFCDGVNRFVLHRYVHQPYGDQYKPGFAMGQWGTHFDRTQTWWEPFQAMVAYWQRCDALLQWGKIADTSPADFGVAAGGASAPAFEADVMKDDLVHGFLDFAEDHCQHNDGGTNADALFNGTTRNGSGGDETLNDGRTYRGYGNGDWLVVHLKRPCQLTEIRTFAAHADERASQNYRVLVAHAAAPGKFVPLATAGKKSTGGKTELRLSGKARDVVAVRFEFQDGPAGFNVYREINLIGTSDVSTGLAENSEAFKSLALAWPIVEAASVKAIHRQEGDTDLYFVANLAATKLEARCTFGVTGQQPELWDPVWGTKQELTDFEFKDGKTMIPLQFDAGQSWFVVFRRALASSPQVSRPPLKNFPALGAVGEISGPWSVQFDPKWGGPEQPVEFASLENWTDRAEPGIKYYSGTADYEKTFDLPDFKSKKQNSKLYLDLGTVRDIASVSLNGHNLGVVWTAPWRVDISNVVKAKNNQLQIKVTNCWANRQIGDEQLPADCVYGKGDMGYGGPLKKFPEWLVKNQPRTSGRFTFATWNYFNKNSPLESSGLLGPVKLVTAN